MNSKQEFHTRPDYENREVTSINRNSAHSPWVESDCPRVEEGSPYRVSLSGEYDFFLYDSPEEAEKFYLPDFDCSAAEKIQVPGNWETQGFDEPIYTNNRYPWDYENGESCTIHPHKGGEGVPNPPMPPAHNPTGCYRRAFTLPENFAGRRVYLSFEGVETAYYLWVNGNPVGYSEDSKLPSEFEITPYLQKGENLFALQVMRFSTATYEEDQDYWYLSGIYRNVWLLAKPQIAIEDYKITAIPDLHQGTGTVSADITVTRKDGFADFLVQLQVFDGDRLLAEGQGEIMPIARYRTQEKPSGNTGRVTLKLDRAELWSPDSPKLYRGVITLLAPDGGKADVESCRFGFKTVEVKNGVVLLNGERLLVRGVNRHEHYPMGRAVPKAHMIEEIRQMKRMNINSVRTCHYPDSPLWYDLCDEYGILLVCECNLETHGVEGLLSHNPDYAASYVERGVRMVKTHKNHVSIYSWSLGNESGFGGNHAAMYGFIKEYDHTRLCQYEAGEPGKNISDIRGNMYAPVHKIMEMLTDTRDDRPIILVEYLYQISNSGGGMRKFRELLEKYPRFQGGYVWDWQDKCLIAKTPEGKEFFAYGGDFNESYVEHDCPPFMTCNGIVLPDLVWKPVAYEVKQAYAPLDIRRPAILSPWQTSCGESDYVLRADPGISLEEYRCKGVLKENGVEIGEREITLSPEMTRGFTFAVPHTKKPGCEYHMDFLITRKTAPWFADAGDTVSATQCTLTGGGAAVVQPLSQKGVTLVETPTTAEISVADFVCIFNKENGALVSAKKKGKEYLKNSIRPCFSRPKTGIDAQPGWGWYQEYNGFSDLTEQLLSAEILHSEQAVTAVFQLAYVREATVLAKAKLSYRVGGEGKIALTYTASAAPHIKIIPRVGVELVVPEGFEQLSYFGFGENENYCDRLESARLGVYESTVEGQNFPFIPPAENGGHEGTRWLSLGDGQGSRLKISGADPFHFDAHHNTIGEYRAARHDHELVRHGETYLHIDAAHSQIGSEMAWSTQLDPAFHLGGKSLTAYWEIELT